MSIDLEVLESGIRTLLEGEGYHLLDFKLGGDDVLRLTVHREPGITHEDCAVAARLVSGWSGTLPGEDPLRLYMLEVSSPGLTRTLKDFGEAVFFIGRRMEVRLREDVHTASGSVSELTGVLLDAGTESIRLQLDDESILDIPEGTIKRMKLTP